MKVTWQGFLRYQRTSEARVLLGIGGLTAEATGARIETQFSRGSISEEERAIRVEMLRELRGKFALEGKEVMDDLDGRDWRSMGNGAYVHRDHVSENE